MSENGEQLRPEEIGKLQILDRVSLEAVWGLLEKCEVKELRAGDALLNRGDRNQTMYMVLSGTVRVHLESPDDDPVARLEGGNTVCEMSVIDDSPASAHVIADAPTRLLCVNEDIFWSLVAASHEFAANLLLMLAQRMRAANENLERSARIQRRLEHEATVDALTGLRNRRWLEKNLPRLVRRFQFGREPLTVLMVDVDHFKRFNDDHGHAAGDRVLAAVARLLLDRLRPTDRAARYGGEEFTVILPGTDVEGAAVAAERLRRFVEDTRVATDDGQALPPVTVSIGMAELGEEELAAGVLARADDALYRAKKNGRNRVEAG